MGFTSELVDELDILTYYNLASGQEGIKVHTSTADQAVVEAAKRLYSKGLITQSDGGYLTDLGREAAEHAQNLLTILNSSSELTTVA